MMSHRSSLMAPGHAPHRRFYEMADRVKYSPCISMVILSFVFSRFHLGFYSHSGESAGSRCILVSDTDEAVLLSNLRPCASNRLLEAGAPLQAEQLKSALMMGHAPGHMLSRGGYRSANRGIGARIPS
jgi:hypothetical protein